MKKFDELVNKYYSSVLLEQEAAPAIPQDGGPTAQPAAPAPAAPAPAAPAPEPEAKPMTSEGKMFLVQLALKALAVDPDTISEQDKAIFETEVTTANADEVADRIRQIIEGQGL